MYKVIKIDCIVRRTILAASTPHFQQLPTPFCFISRCAKELNQWVTLLEYSKNGVYDPLLILESAWRIPAWDIMKEALSNVEYPKELAWKIQMYRGYLLICSPEDKQLPFNEACVESAPALCLKEWRRLPHIVSHIHLPYLQAAQLIIELQEAYQIHKDLKQDNQDSLHDMKAIVKTWRNRLPVIADDLTHWNDIFTWRQHHYQFIIQHYERNKETTQGNAMLGVHASAQVRLILRLCNVNNHQTLLFLFYSQLYILVKLPENTN